MKKFHLPSLPVVLLALCLAAWHIAGASEKDPPVVIPGISGNSTTTKFGDGYITRTADGKTYTTQKFGDGWLTRGPDGQVYTTRKFGDGAITRGDDGTAVTTRSFGDGYLSRTEDGGTTTTRRFGQGTLSTDDAGTTQTSTRFGSGYTTQQTSTTETKKEAPRPVLVLPADSEKKEKDTE